MVGLCQYKGVCVNVGMLICIHIDFCGNGGNVIKLKFAYVCVVNKFIIISPQMYVYIEWIKPLCGSHSHTKFQPFEIEHLRAKSDTFPPPHYHHKGSGIT